MLRKDSSKRCDEFCIWIVNIKSINVSQFFQLLRYKINFTVTLIVSGTLHGLNCWWRTLYLLCHILEASDYLKLKRHIAKFGSYGFCFILKTLAWSTAIAPAFSYLMHILHPESHCIFLPWSEPEQPPKAWLNPIFLPHDRRHQNLVGHNWWWFPHNHLKSSIRSSGHPQILESSSPECSEFYF